MNNRLEGKIALVTGGNSGIGLATAKRFVQEGAYVFITGRRQDALDQAIQQIGANSAAIQADSSRMADLDHVFEEIREKKGKLDVLFVNAGGGEFASIGEYTEEHFDKTFDTNVKGLVFTVQKALPLMSDGSSIILNASIVSIKGMPAFSVYAATKAAVRSFARSWILELKGRGIRVNVVSPGPIDTPGMRGLSPNEEQSQAFVDGMTQQVPLGRIGQPEDIANAALFLATEESSFVNGIELFVDGGMAQV